MLQGPSGNDGLPGPAGAMGQQGPPGQIGFTGPKGQTVSTFMVIELVTVKPHLHGRLFCGRFFDKNESGKVAFTPMRF